MSAVSEVQKIALNTFSLEAAAVGNLASLVNSNFETIITELHQCKGRIIVTGIGKSGLVATKIVATLNSTGTPAIFMHAADAIHGDLGIIQKNDIVICFSKSGNSPEIKTLIPFIKNRHNTVIGITENEHSFLAQESDYSLVTPAEKEACPNNLAPTTSTTVQLAMGDALAMCLMHLNKFDASAFAFYHPGGQLGKQLLLTIGQMVSQHEVAQVVPQASISDVIQEMTSKRLGATVVLDGKKILGLVTDGDLRRMLQKFETLQNLTAADIMTANPYQSDSQMLAKDALAFMNAKKINHLIVCDAHQDYLGIVHILDFIKEGIKNE